MVSRCNSEDLISPINITSNNIINNCNVKCSLITNYNNTNVSAYNKGSYLSLDYELNTKSNFHIKFNSIKMNINDVRLYFPSIHKYDNTQSDGELLIIHNGNGSNCIISIPIISNNSSTKGEKILTTILENVISGNPNKNESTTLNISNFNLSDLLPLNIPYYYYQGQLVFDPCTQNYNYIIFNKNDYAIHINSNLLQQLKDIFKQQPNSVSLVKDMKILSYNKNGATNVELKGNDDIYIECKPINELGTANNSTDEYNNINTEMEQNTRENKINNKKTDHSMTFEDLTKNPAFDIIISFFGMFVLYMGGKYVLNFVRSRNNKI